ncbi:MAG: serine hydrolase [Bacteroidales bacterium]|nr:serine hydrolase [Bacteroidales bacterium]
MKNIVKFVIPLILVIVIPFILLVQKKENNLQKYDRITQKVFDEFQPTGLSIAIVQNGDIIYQKALGYKNAHNVDFLDNNDIFNIASCTKAFTAAGIGELVQEGLLSWDDKVIDYIPNFKLDDEYITNNLTLKDILSHRTGLGTFYGDLLWYNSTYTNSEVIERMQYLPIVHDFRTGFGYQNNMYMIAGEIIESVTGESWESFIKQTFFVPLEMNDSRTSSDQFDGTEDIAFPHYQDSVIGVHYYQATKPAISMWSTPGDLSNWASMWLNNGKWKNDQILSPEIIRTLMSPQTILPVSEERESLGIHFRNYALGWITYDYNGRKIVEHSGRMPGYISKVALVPEENMAVIILNNGFEQYGNNALFYSIIDIATDHYNTDWVNYYQNTKMESVNSEKEFCDIRLATKNTDIKPTLPNEAFTGLFNDKMYGIAEIKLENNELSCTFLPAKKIFTSKMEHWNENTFKVEFKDPFLPYGLIKFEIDESNKVTGFKIDIPSSDFHFNNLDFKKTN